MRPFVQDLINRAVEGTLSSYGQTWTSLGIPIVTALVYWCIRRYSQGGWKGVVSHPDGWRKWFRDASLALGVGLVMIVLVFAANVSLAAYERDVDRQNAISSLEAENAGLRDLPRKVREQAAENTRLAERIAVLERDLGNARARKEPLIVLGSGTALSREACDAIGLFVAEGQAILRETRKQASPPPDKKAEDWERRVAMFLETTFGRGSVGLFRNASGLPIGITTLDSEIHRNIEGYLTVRLARLQQFSQKCF